MVFYSLDGGLGGVESIVVWFDNFNVDFFFLMNALIPCEHSLSVTYKLGDKFLSYK